MQVLHHASFPGSDQYRDLIVPVEIGKTPQSWVSGGYTGTKEHEFPLKAYHVSP